MNAVGRGRKRREGTRGRGWPGNEKRDGDTTIEEGEKRAELKEEVGGRRRTEGGGLRGRKKAGGSGEETIGGSWRKKKSSNVDGKRESKWRTKS